MIFVFDRGESIVGKEENAGKQHFPLFSSTGHRPASLCHGLLSVVRPVVRTYEPDIVGLGLG